MRLRTKSEQEAFLDGFERCAESIVPYLSDYGKKKLNGLLMTVRSAVEGEDKEASK